jgi:hypothetical protein
LHAATRRPTALSVKSPTGGHDVFDRHEGAGTDQDLAGLSFVAKPVGNIGDGADRDIVEASLKAYNAERGIAVRDTDAEAWVMA